MLIRQSLGTAIDSAPALRRRAAPHAFIAKQRHLTFTGATGAAIKIKQKKNLPLSINGGTAILRSLGGRPVT
jgi:hypothetical protein